jgi:hypothetical protein
MLSTIVFRPVLDDSTSRHLSTKVPFLGENLIKLVGCVSSSSESIPGKLRSREGFNCIFAGAEKPMEVLQLPEKFIESDY